MSIQYHFTGIFPPLQSFFQNSFQQTTQKFLHPAARLRHAGQRGLFFSCAHSIANCPIGLQTLRAGMIRLPCRISLCLVEAACGRLRYGLRFLRRGAQCAPASDHLLSFPFVGADVPIRPLCQVSERYLGISPAGEFLLQRCKRNQKTAGGGSRAFTMPYPAAPRTPVCFTGEPSRGFVPPSGAGKRQDTGPRAARCRSVLTE